ncbi:hypothetical protein EV1_018647 [Malus domestica]
MTTTTAHPLHCLPSWRKGSPAAAAKSSAPPTSLQSFAKVYHVHNVLTGQSVAVKVINKKNLIGTNLMSNINKLYEVLASKAQQLHSHCTPVALPAVAEEANLVDLFSSPVDTHVKLYKD